MKYFILTVLALVSTLATKAQIEFTTEHMKSSGRVINSGAPMAICDLNDDGLDDMILMDESQNLTVVYQTLGLKSRHEVPIHPVFNVRAWSMVVADVSDDAPGLEIMVFSSQGLAMLKAQGPFGPFEQSVLSSANFLTQSASMADMDDDGDLDLFVCDDNDVNFVALNQGNGVFVQSGTVMDFTTNPASDQSGNYGSVFSDFDRDGDLDFYLSKCKGGADPGDIRRTNQFFIKTADGYEQSDAYPNLLSNAQSWAADFIDVDNDGDWDLLVANHDAPTELFIQDENGNFSDEAALRGVDDFWGIIQIVSADYDNDGDVDIYIVGNEHRMYVNDGNGYFSEVSLLANTSIGSATAGDLNNDGLVDIYTSHMTVYNDPVGAADNIFWNTTPDAGDFIKFKLKSTNSKNINAVGATVEIFNGGQSQIRELRTGESYGIVKSNIVHFGLGDYAGIDSFHVHWPGSAVESYGPLPSNQLYQINEGGQVVSLSELSITSSRKVLCPGGSVELSAPVADGYIWSDGSTTQTIDVTSAGPYWVSILRDGRWMRLHSYQVIAGPAARPTIGYDTELKCVGEPMTLRAITPYSADVVWSNSQFGEINSVTEPGQYWYRFIGECSVLQSDTFDVVENQVISPVYENDTVMINENARLKSSYSSTQWTDDTTSMTVLSQGNFFYIDNLERDSVLYARALDTSAGIQQTCGLLAPGGISGYHDNGIAQSMHFFTKGACTLASVVSYTDSEGVREIVITDRETGEVVFSALVVMEVGENYITLNADLEAHRQYEINTNEDVNLDQLGYRSPKLLRTQLPVEYPLSNDYIDILGSDVTQGYYYYFYDWQVIGRKTICASPWEPVYAVADSGTSTSNVLLDDADIQLFPNPSYGSFSVTIDNPERWSKMELINAQGQVILKQNRIEAHMTLQPKISGVYIARFFHENSPQVFEKQIILLE